VASATERVPPMANPIDNSFSKFLEFVVLAITVGCSVWMSFLAATAPRYVTG
jgi:hypothetical protein